MVCPRRRKADSVDLGRTPDTAEPARFIPSRAMRVLMLHQQSGPYGSGGLQAMYRLHTGLRRRGVESTIACKRRELDSPEIYELPRADRIEDFLGTFSWRLGLNDVHCVSTFKIKNFKPFLDADVVNTHGIHTNWFNYLALPGMGQRKPLVMTLHDMWALTGHCSQSYECQRWRTGCGKCPHLDVFPPVGRDGTAIEWRLKNWVYQRTPMTIVSPSKWLADLARESMLSHYAIHHIPNGVDVNVYRPLDKNDCRAQLGVPRDRLVIMFASAALNNPGKGGDLLIEALRILPRSVKSQALLLLLGDRSEALSERAGIDSMSLGFIRDDAPKAVAFSAADIFVLPSRAENHSLVLLEAMACATPGVAFKVGGNPEIVQHLDTGYLAEPLSAESLSEGITTLLEDRDLRQRIGCRARQVICEEFSLDQHVERYIDLYEQVTGIAATA